MKKIWTFLRNHYSDIYKGILLLISLVILVSFFPKEAKFKYEFTRGRPWMNEDLIAPFDFAVLKSQQDIQKEKDDILKNRNLYFTFDLELNDDIRTNFLNDFQSLWNSKYQDEQEELKKITEEKGQKILDGIITRGVIKPVSEIENRPQDFRITLIIQNTAEQVKLSDLFDIHSAYETVQKQVNEAENVDKELLIQLFENAIAQNVFFNNKVTKTEEQKLIDQISLTKGMVQKGERIISKGDLITKNKYQVLESLRTEYESRLGTSTNYYLILTGQVLLVAISLLVLTFFLYFFRRDILDENKKVVLILLIIILMVFITSLALKFDVQYIYLVPICLGPILIRVFFDTRLALYVYLITIILIGFLVPNGFQFVFMQFITGIITIFSIINLQRRSQFLFTSLVIFLSYSAIYTGLILIHEGSIHEIRLVNYAMFAGSAILILFAYPLIFLFEKIFGLVTNVTLLELSDTNGKLLRELSRRAPGTFQHSLQVANLAEESLHEIGGDTLLARTGALYHDIGKMDNSIYFIENQVTGVNPHDELTYDESARIIINHVIRGIEIAKKHKLPEQIIDFIRTHHGTRKVDYFYQKQKNDFPDDIIDEQDFTYSGPIPYSKETSVVMMTDSVEAASRSLKVIDEQTINDLVENVINKQVETGQFINSDITLRDISKIKKILKKKLMNIYHIRIEYPS